MKEEYYNKIKEEIFCLTRRLRIGFGFSQALDDIFRRFEILEEMHQTKGRDISSDDLKIKSYEQIKTIVQGNINGYNDDVALKGVVDRVEMTEEILEKI